MKITSIQSNKEYKRDHLKEETVTIKLTNKEDDIQSKALYYLICAVNKMKYQNYKDLDFMTKMQVDARIDAAIDFLNEMRK